MVDKRSPSQIEDKGGMVDDEIELVSDRRS